MFHSLGHPRITHREARRIATEHMRSHWMEYEDFVPAVDRDTYLRDMRRDGTWGDHLTAHAFSEATRTPVTIVDPSQHVITVFQPGGGGGLVRDDGIRLIFDGCHYDAVL